MERIWAVWVAALLSGYALRAEDGFPVAFQDDSGHELRFEEPPERVVSLNPGNTEILLRLGESRRLVGVDQYSKRTGEARGIRSVGSLLRPSFEIILELDPDLVLIADIAEQHRGKLESLGLKVAQISPSRLEGVYEAVMRLGRVTGARDQARSVVGDMRRRVRQVENKVEGIPPERRPGVFVEIWPDPLRSAGPGTFIHELITIAGGRNIAAEALTEWPLFSLETLLERDPDVIITPRPSSREEILSGRRGQWRSLGAVREQRVYVIDQDQFSRPGPRLIDALETLARVLHKGP